MTCPHVALDIMLSKDLSTVFEICSHCNQLVAMAPWDDSYDKKPYYMAMHAGFREIFEFKLGLIFHKQHHRIHFQGRDINAPVKFYRNQNLIIQNNIQKQQALFGPKQAPTPPATTAPAIKEARFFSRMGDAQNI